MRVIAGYFFFSLRLILLLTLLTSGASQAHKITSSGMRASNVVCSQVLGAGASLTSNFDRYVRHALSKIGFRLHKEIQAMNRETSLITSPLSTFGVLLMILNGANEKLRDEMMQALGLNWGGSRNLPYVNEAFANILQQLRAMDPTVFGMVNFVLLDAKTKPLQSFVDSIRVFGGSVEEFDFRNSNDARTQMNQRIFEATHGHIETFIQGDPKRGWLLNAGYFQDGWTMPFNEKDTVTAPFYTTELLPRDVALMAHHNEILPYYLSAERFEMVSLPYLSGTTADIIVPGNSIHEQGERPRDGAPTLHDVLREFNVDSYEQWVQGLRVRETFSVKIPRWKIRSHTSNALMLVLRDWMPELFGSKGKLTALSKPSFALNHVSQEAVFETDELGSQGGMVTGGGVLVSFKPSVIANRPFLVVIRHIATGIPLFVISEWAPKNVPSPEH